MSQPQSIPDMLRKTLEDYQLSRGERRALGSVLRDLDPTPENLGLFRSYAFGLARETLDGVHGSAVLEWLEDVVKLLQASAHAPAAVRSEVHFSPDEDCALRIAGMFQVARTAIDVCVFTITDDRISSAILDAQRRGVRLRLITDDDKASDQGSDAQRLASAGVPLRYDRSPYHMHHKYAIFDGQRLLTGSYNWTRSAADNNQDNFLITDDRELVQPFQAHFQRLWAQYR